MAKKLTKRQILSHSIRQFKRNAKKEFIACSLRIYEVEQAIRPVDLIANAALNRSINVAMGFAHLVEKDDYIAAIPLLRVQLDTALRFFATTLVKDYNKFTTDFMEGIPIKDMLSYEDKKMSDNYLARKLEPYFPGVLKLYKTTSGHIHFSNEHLYQNTRTDKKQERGITVQVGYKNPYRVDKKLEIVNTMNELCKLVVISVEQWKHQKIKLVNIGK